MFTKEVRDSGMRSRHNYSVYISGRILHSSLNPNMEIIINPLCDERDWRGEEIFFFAECAFDEWFDNEKEDIGDTTLPEYIENRLEKEGFVLGEDYKMYIDAQWDRMEILI